MLILDVGALLVLPTIMLLLTHDSIAVIVTLLFVIVFMYSPDKLNSQNYNKNIFYSPSAGYIRSITQDEENIHISMFLNVFDNHTQYFPVESILVHSQKVNGLFEPAYQEHSINNQKVEHTIQSIHHGFIYKITQITGLLTRRILVLAKKDQVYKTGDRLGFIVFGSRVDISIPKSIVKEVLIAPNSHIQEMTKIIELKEFAD